MGRVVMGTIKVQCLGKKCKKINMSMDSGHFFITKEKLVERIRNGYG